MISMKFRKVSFTVDDPNKGCSERTFHNFINLGGYKGFFAKLMTLMMTYLIEGVGCRS